jgi:hypothetical protein
MTPVPPATRALASAFVPARRTSEGIAAWRIAISKHRAASTKDMEDIPIFLQLWIEQLLGKGLSAGDLVRLALSSGLFAYTLRQSTFKVRSARLAELLGRIALVQGEQGIVPGFRFARMGLRQKDNQWQMDPVGVHQKLVATKNRVAERQEATQERELKRARRQPAKRSRGSVRSRT